jgi:hypothetical protein
VLFTDPDSLGVQILRKLNADVRKVDTSLRKVMQKTSSQSPPTGMNEKRNPKKENSD